MQGSDTDIFLQELDRKLWNAADRLRSNLDAAVYKHAVLGLIFLKYIYEAFLNDQHPDLRADFVMANPPFNISEWWDGRLEGEPRWQYGTPLKRNANFAWLQHMIYHLAPTGSMALLLANGSMFSNTKARATSAKPSWRPT